MAAPAGLRAGSDGRGIAGFYLLTGLPLAVAYRKAVQFTGRVVALVGITLAAAVVTWAFSPIKFQADMGILLTFMFLWNMLGALVLIPALSYVLLPTARVCGEKTSSAAAALALHS